MSYISRFNLSGKSIANDIYHAVENGTIRFETQVADGRRLDQYAEDFYGPGNGMNYWIIAAASGIRWSFGIGCGSGIDPNNYKSDTVIFIPNLEDVINLKKRR